MASGEAKNFRVVVVADDGIVSELLRKVCTITHLQPRFVEDVVAARAAVVEDNPIAVICAASIPDDDALAFARGLLLTQVVLVLDSEPDGSAIGIDTVLTRPLAADAVITALRRIAERAGILALPRLLIVENDRYFAHVLERGLGASFAVTVVHSVEDAYTHIREHNEPDAILVELRLISPSFHPSLDALAAGLSERTVFMTGGLVTDDAQVFLGHIPGRWIYKPFPIEAARSLIVGVVDKPRDDEN